MKIEYSVNHGQIEARNKGEIILAQDAVVTNEGFDLGPRKGKLHLTFRPKDRRLDFKFRLLNDDGSEFAKGGIRDEQRDTPWGHTYEI